jgi:hypothetical protein
MVFYFSQHFDVKQWHSMDGDQVLGLLDLLVDIAEFVLQDGPVINFLGIADFEHTLHDSIPGSVLLGLDFSDFVIIRI